MTNQDTDQSSEPLSPTEANDAADKRDEPSEGASFPIVSVGASAGGLEAFLRLLQALPADTGMAFVLVQHLAPSHPSALAEILSRATKMTVSEVQDEPIVEPNHIYVIPPDRSMIIVRGALQLLPRGVGLHRPIDQFFRSLAEDRRHQAIAVVLSGTATDGTLGLEAIKAEGGITFAQDATAQHEGMPLSAIASGCVDFVLPPNEIAREIVRISRHPYAVPEAEARETDDQPNLAQVVQLLHHVTGVDFTHYKFNTLYRRVTRRMVFQKMDALTDYLQYLRQTPTEVESLYQDILISVTRFFRDNESFETLKSEVFPRLLKDRSRYDPVRLWTIGCSTGQEAYSLAMAFTEAAEAAGSSVTLQLFATDLNAVGIEKARAGLYPKDIAQEVSPERLRRFFTEVDGHYRISKTIRDACVFSRHNVLADPPFSRIDLISCRNLLIYLEPVLQQKIVSTLHYSLNPAGCLWLGGSETIGGFQNLFETQDARHKIYIKKPGSRPGHGHFPLQHGVVPRSPFISVTARSNESTDLPREADRVLSIKFAPPGVLVSADLDILQYRGNTGPYLAPAPGKASLSLLKMLREGLLVAVRAAIVRAGKEDAPVREKGLQVKSNGGYHEVAIDVIPIQGSGGQEGGFLVLFEDAPANGGRQPAGGSELSGTHEHQRADAPRWPEPLDTDNACLVHELAATREYLQSLIEQQEAANEELQSANEEVQSANEELQSTNEELETSKEEIQSSNEELATVNDELQNRNIELNRGNNDLVNLLGSIQTAIVILGPDLRVRRFTPKAEKLLNLLPTDVGRPLAEIKLNIDNLPDLEPLLAEVLDTVTTSERDVQDRHGRWYSLRLRPYKTLENKIDGVVVMLVDVDAMKRAHAYTESIVATVREPLLVLDKDLRVQTASRSFYEIFRAAPANTVDRPLFELGNGQWDIPDLRRLLEEVLPRDHQVTDFEMEHEFEQIGRKTMRLNARRLIQAADHAPLILLAIEDITERRQEQLLIEISETRFRRLFEAAHDGILILDAATRKITHVNPFLMKLLDYPAEYFLGKELWEIGFLRDKEASRSAMQQLEEQGSLRYESLPLEDSHGGKRPVEMVANLYQEDHHPVIQCNIRDISERSRLETLHRGQAAELSDLHRRKDEFLAMLSHELRSPLAPIANAVQLLGLQRESENRIQRQARGIIQRQVGQLQHLVDDLLEVSRLTTGKVQLRRVPVTISSIIEGAVETVRPLIEQRRHELTVSLPTEPIWMNADTSRLEQVIVNLLSNAAKYTAEGGHICLTVELNVAGTLRVPSLGKNDTQRVPMPGSDGMQSLPLPATEVLIRVRDTGVGISPELLPHIFDLFTQAERSLDRSQGGLGIGLALVQRLTELHDGKVEVSSVIGEGSEFVVRLPTLNQDLQVANFEAGVPSSLTTDDLRLANPLKVLVVDDNPDTVLSFSILLKTSGHDVRTAHDGPAAVQMAFDYEPDVILLDIGLPGLNGFEVANRIRKQTSLKHVVLVALTGYGQETDRQNALQAGFDHHLVKPVRLAQLQKILAKVSEIGM